MDRVARIAPTQYLFLERPLPQGLADLDREIDFADGSVRMTRRTYGEEAYSQYRRNLGREADLGAASPFNNYIYALDRLRIFEGGERGIQFCLDRGMMDPGALDRLFPGWTVRSLMEEPVSALLGACRVRPFTAYFDGYEHAAETPSRFWGRFGVWTSVMSRAKLIDGNVQRFVREAPSTEVAVPEAVVAELEHFTEFEGRSLSPAARAWLQTNFPAKSLTVYRGTGMSGRTVEVLDQRAKDRFGLSVTGLHAGASVTMSRDRDTSWTLTPQVAREFSRSHGTIKLLLRAKLAPSQIVVNLTEVPLRVRRLFRHFNQNEVIAAPGVIRAEVLTVGADPDFLRELPPELEFVPRVGLFPRGRAASARIVSRFLAPSP